ncbi:TIGR03618 family F420-dependent PPOX class oxidoreductase [Pseudonocardia acaciae]|uniref:TIGR03618 family F420-dependent PPOX class oxidoreductase n=1 Tax=Pseudonocardia acaciae TaxID=551276 RepID=UPI000566FB8E|nr:TIGR03618 family F420-dependent PPOX class oxidoreductase [Pseudonocardia acaciae]
MTRSVPDRQVLPPSARRLFERDLHATVVTTNPDGTPQVSLVWVELDGDDIVFGAEGWRRKVQNLRRDPVAAVIVQDTCRADNGLVRFLTVRGRATIDGPGIADRFTRLMDRLARRYLGTEAYPLPNRGSRTAVIVRIRPERVGGLGPWVGAG